MKIRDDFLPLAIPDITDEEIAEVVDTLKSGWISVGPKVRAFEAAMAERHQTRNAIAVSSCTSALFLVAKALDIGPGDKVVVPSMSWPSTANIVEQLGATPVFLDVDRLTANITAELLEEALHRHGNSVKAVIPVHFSGLPVDIEGIEEVASAAGVRVIYDAAHAIFSQYRGKPVGSFGTAACFSFYAIKNLTCGDAGVITTDDEGLAETMRLWGYHGMDKDSWKRYSADGGSPHVECRVPGFKFNLTDLQAALGLAQLRRADELRDARHRLIRCYHELLEPMNDLDVAPFETEAGGWGDHLVVVRLLEENLNRDRVLECLRERRVGTNIHFLPIHQHDFYRKQYPDVSLPNTEWLGQRILSLPLCTKYSENDVRYAVDALRDVLDSGEARRTRN